MRVTTFVDEDGTEYALLDDPEEVRNAPPSRHTPPSAASVPARRTRAVPIARPRSQAPAHRLVRVDDPMPAKTAKVLEFIEVFTDGVAELIPLPDKPPMPTGEVAVDLHNQNEHRQALHAHRVLTSRIRASGRVLSKVFRLLLEE